MRFELFIASRYLRAKRRQAVIGVITGISIAGVAAGVASLVVALAINNGFRQDLQNRLLGSTSHINLLRVESDGIKDWRPLMERLSKQPHVVAAAPAIYEQVLISRGPRARGAVLKGMIPGGRAQGQRSVGYREDWFGGSRWIRMRTVRGFKSNSRLRRTEFRPTQPWMISGGRAAAGSCDASHYSGQGHGGRVGRDVGIDCAGDQPAGRTDAVWDGARSTRASGWRGFLILVFTITTAPGRSRGLSTRSSF